MTKTRVGPTRDLAKKKGRTSSYKCVGIMLSGASVKNLPVSFLPLIICMLPVHAPHDIDANDIPSKDRSYIMRRITQIVPLDILAILHISRVFVCWPAYFVVRCALHLSGYIRYTSQNLPSDPYQRPLADPAFAWPTQRCGMHLPLLSLFLSGTGRIGRQLQG